MLLPLALALLQSLPLDLDAATSRTVEVVTPTPALVARALEFAGFDVGDCGQAVTPTGVRVTVTPEELNALLVRGYDLRVVDVGRPLRDLLAERSQSDGVPSGYLDLQAIEAELYAYAQAHPTLAQVVDLTVRFNAPATVEGRHILALKVSDNVTADEDEPAFLLVSAHHCREIVTPVIALDTIERLLGGYATDPNIRAVVDAQELWIVPVWNPDGYHHVFTVDNLWRKNRRVFSGGTGVDLNRNYPFLWSTACGGSTNAGSQTYRGPAPASEAETQAMLALSADRHFQKVLDYHSTGNETLWGYACPTSPIDAFWRAEATALSVASGYGGAERRPSADGEQYLWQFATTGAMAYLTETHTQFQPTYASAQAEAARVWPGTLHLLQRAMPIEGHVRSACSGAPVSASITYVSPTFSQGEGNSSNGRFGRFHAFLPPGTHTLRFEAAGFAPAVRQVVVQANATTTLDVDLDPLNGGATVFCPATASSTGLVPTIGPVGSTSVSANQFAVQVGGLPALELTALLLGQNLTQLQVFGGTLCIGRPQQRVGVAAADLLGSVQIPVNLAAAQVSAGVSYGLQLYYRDLAAGGSQLNFSPALMLTFCP
ncbi:MAG: M14 family zinc carboxypeptidase [Planctomycetota bacterium]